MGMGVGGLIRSPDDEAPEGEAANERPADRPLYVPRIAAIVLAAGESAGVAGDNELLREVGGLPLVRRAVDAACASRCSQVMVVTGFEAARVEAAFAGSPVSIAYNPEFGTGMSSSLRCGLKAVPRDVDGIVVPLGNMPSITAAHADRLIDAFDPESPSIIVPQRGNPILWPRRLFDEIRGLTGDSGARGLLERHRAEIATVEFDCNAIFTGIDTTSG